MRVRYHIMHVFFYSDGKKVVVLVMCYGCKQGITRYDAAIFP